MTDTAPLYFQSHLGMLKPANLAAEKAMQEIKGRVVVTIKGGVANQRRRGLYWLVAALVAPLLNDRHGLTLTENDLHDITREKFEMFDRNKLPSGEVHKRYWSTSNRAMNEADRAAFTDRALQLWSKWTEVDVTTLRNEALKGDEQ